MDGLRILRDRVFWDHQRWLDFLNRYAVLVHIAVMPISVLAAYPLFVIHVQSVQGKEAIIEKFILYFLFLMHRIAMTEIFPVFFLIPLLFVVFFYFLSFHTMLMTYRRKKWGACMAVFASFVFYFGLIYSHGVYCERSYDRISRYANQSMTFREMVWECGLPLYYSIESPRTLRAHYTNGTAERLATISAPHFFATVSVDNIPNIWRD